MSVVGRDACHERSPYFAAGHCYVDDPLFSLRGTAKQRVRSMIRIIIIWSILGLPLAFKKAQFGRKVTWIGFQLEKLIDRFVVTVPREND